MSPHAGSVPWDRQRPDDPPFRGIVTIVTRAGPFESSTRLWRCQHRHRTSATALRCAARALARPDMWDTPR